MGSTAVISSCYVKVIWHVRSAVIVGSNISQRSSFIL